MNQAKFSCRVGATGPGLRLRLELDDQVFFDGDPYDHGQCSILFDDDEREHLLVFTLAGKSPEHTKISTDGLIMEDLVVEISDISFDDIQLGHTFTSLAVYTHDWNGTGATTTQPFYSTMGCNGTVSLEFNTPVYLWLLEHM
jgi:hypothetical protein